MISAIIAGLIIGLISYKVIDEIWFYIDKKEAKKHNEKIDKLYQAAQVDFHIISMSANDYGVISSQDAGLRQKHHHHDDNKQC